MSTRPRLWQPCRARLRDTGGFTLVEVLVAFTVMATLLSVLFRGVVTIRAGSRAYDDHIRQQVVAHTVLEDALAKRDLPPGRYSGVLDGCRWTLISKPIDLTRQLPSKDTDGAPAPPAKPPLAANGSKPAAAENEMSRWQTQKLIVQVETRGRPLEIETIRLAALGDEARR